MWRIIERLRRARRPRFRRRVAELGLPSLAMDYLERHERLADAWNAIPRADWVLELAVRAGIEPAVLGPGLDHLLEVAHLCHARLDLERLEETFGRYRSGGLEASAFLELALPALTTIVDAQPDVSAARAVVRAPGVRTRRRTLLELDEYDLQHGAAHADLARSLRTQIPFEAIARALGEPSRAPYR